MGSGPTIHLEGKGDFPEWDEEGYEYQYRRGQSREAQGMRGTEADREVGVVGF